MTRPRPPPAEHPRSGGRWRSGLFEGKRTEMGYIKTAVPGIFARGNSYSVAFRDPITKKTVFRTAGSSFADAKALKRQLEDQRERGISTQATKLTVPELWTSFVEDHLSQLAPSTQADYLSAWSRYIEPRYRRSRVVDISRAEALAFKGDLRGKFSAVPLARTVAQAGGGHAHMRDEQIYVRLPRGVEVTQETVGDFQVGDVDREDVLDHVLPSVIQIGLAVLRAGSFHEIELALFDVDFADDFAMPEFTPGERKIDVLREKKRFAHFAI